MNLMDTDSITAFRDSETEVAITPWLSIIISVYQLEDYIADCLNSILSQKFRDFELVVVLDGPTDRSEEILVDYQHSDDRITLIRQPNKGLSSARNRGFKEARGTYILFVDGDDILEEDALQHLYHHALEYECPDLLFFSYQILEMDPDRHFWSKRKKPFHAEALYSGPHTGPELLQLMMENKDYWPAAWRQIMKKEFLLAVDAQFHEDIFYFEDVLFTTEMLLKANHAAYLPLVLYNYRIRPNQMTRGEKTLVQSVSYFKVLIYIAALSHDNKTAWQKVPYLPIYLMNYLHNIQMHFVTDIQEHAESFFDILGDDEGVYHLLVDYPVQLFRSYQDLKRQCRQNHILEKKLLDCQQHEKKLLDEVDRLSLELQLLRAQLDKIETQKSAKIARQIIAGGFRCLREHGIIHTGRNLIFRLNHCILYIKSKRNSL